MAVRRKGRGDDALGRRPVLHRSARSTRSRPTMGVPARAGSSRGGTDPGQNIPIGTLFRDVADRFGVPGALPTPIATLSIDALRLSFNTKTQHFKFTADASFKADDKSIGIGVLVDVTHSAAGAYSPPAGRHTLHRRLELLAGVPGGRQGGVRRTEQLVRRLLGQQDRGRPRHQAPGRLGIHGPGQGRPRGPDDRPEARAVRVQQGRQRAPRRTCSASTSTSRCPRRSPPCRWSASCCRRMRQSR